MKQQFLKSFVNHDNFYYEKLEKDVKAIFSFSAIFYSELNKFYYPFFQDI